MKPERWNPGADLSAPLRWRNPRRVELSLDLFEEDRSDEWIAAVHGVMAATPQHTYQVLTKRAERAADWFRWISRRSSDAHSYPVGFVVGLASQFLFMPSTDFMPELTVQWPVWPLRNVWLGVSVEDQQRADERIPYLLRCPAAVRFLSVEPMLGPINLRKWLNRGLPSCEIDWVIVGGESGPGARPCDVAWIRSIVQPCRAAGVPVFVKQLGSVAGNYLPRDDGDQPDFFREPYRDRKGGDPSEWPEDLRVREWPEVTP